MVDFIIQNTNRSRSPVFANRHHHRHFISSSSSSADRVHSRGPLRQPRVATMSSLGPFSTNAEGCTVTDLLDP